MKKTFTILLMLFAINGFSQIPSGYYNSAEGLAGDALKSALHNIIDNHTEKSYNAIRYILDETDRDPNNSNNVILIYKGSSVSGVWDSGATWNREHVWAKSHGDFGTSAPAGSDLHHIRPADPSVNSSRGNKDFDNGGTPHHEAIGCFHDSDSWEPRDEVKGDVARMMFYMAVRYEGDVSGEPDLELVDYTGTSGSIFGKLSALRQWHEQDPVDDFERNRNNVIYSHQGNRNPFIDHPEYVEAMFNPPSTNASLIEKDAIEIYPNPVLNELNVVAPENTTRELYTIIGEKLKSWKEETIDVSDLDAGIYFVIVKDNFGVTIKNQKIIKK